MTDPQTPISRDAVAAGDDDVIDLRLLAHAIWRRKWLVLLATFAGGALGVGFSHYNTRYQSEGLLLMPTTSVEKFKQYEVALANEPRLNEFLERSGQADQPAAAILRDIVHDPGRLADAVRPEFGFTDRDAKQFGVKVEDAGGLIGLRLAVSEREKRTVAPVLLLSEYVRDTALKVDLESRLLKWCLDYQIRERELRNEQLDADFFVNQQREKAERLRDLIARTPGAASLDSRQLVSIENGGERFLSPVAQLVATEINVADTELASERRERLRIEAGFKQLYYCKARELLDSKITARQFLQQLAPTRDEVFAKADMTVNVNEQVANKLLLQQQRWNNNYISRMRFVVSPEGAQVRVRKPGPVLGLLAGLIAGALGGTALALGLSWWRRNRALIVADRD